MPHATLSCCLGFVWSGLRVVWSLGLDYWWYGRLPSSALALPAFICLPRTVLSVAYWGVRVAVVEVGCSGGSGWL